MSEIDRGRVPAPPSHRDQVRRLIDEHGEQGAADVLHTTRFTVGRLVAGLPIGEATRTLVALKLGVLGVLDGDEAARP